MLTLEEKIGQMLMAGFEGLEPPQYILDWLAAGRIGGVILFARNVETPQQVADLTRACHQAAKRPILIGIDQEGGSVARFRRQFTESPGAMALSAATNGLALSEQIAQVMAQELQALGVNWDYAPVVDIVYEDNIDNPAVGTRSFGADKARVGAFASAMAKGLQDYGVAACAKHFPGLGGTEIDTHLATAVIDTSLEHLIENDLAPYRAVIDAGVASIMTTHTVFAALDDTHPATLSPVVIKRLLREELGFDDVIASDCMEMQAITDHYGSGESAVLAVEADVDLVQFSHSRDMQVAAFRSIMEAVKSGRIPSARIDQSVARIQRLKAQFPANVHPDSASILSKEHVEIVNSAAREGVVVIRADNAVFPLNKFKGKVGLVEFRSIAESRVMEYGESTTLTKLMKHEFKHIDAISMFSGDTDSQKLERAFSIAANSDLLLLATRNAHVIASQLELARQLAEAANQTILLCMRNPYDANVLPESATVICACGDSEPSVKAVVSALKGEYTPHGQLPVPLKAIG
jgi:beta-N-acetylhexosaminidase